MPYATIQCSDHDAHMNFGHNLNVDVVKTFMIYLNES